MRPASPTAGGFTLIEVLVALAIVVLGMAAVMGALTSSADTLVYLRDKTFAQWVALNQIATLRLSGLQPPTGTSDGDTDFAGRRWHWRQEVIETEIPGARRIDVSVRLASTQSTAEDKDWLTTASGISSDAFAPPNPVSPAWGSQAIPGQQAQQALGAPGVSRAPSPAPQGSQ